ncbi:MAG: DUF3341 domain-containing protein [Acetobacteraceae bacterium]|nr:DUF3341 domain-containing protein [Acetobacteraceae bacterium]
MAEPKHSSGAPLWGVSAEFDTPEAMLSAIRSLKPRRFGRIDAYSPIPVEGASEALGLPPRPIYPFALGASLLGAAARFGMCTYATIWGYRFDIGGRPLFSWPAFVVPSVSFAALLGAIVVYALLLLMSRLPRLNHPAFNTANFTRASADRFFVAVEARDDSFDADAIEAAFVALPARPHAIHRVPR